MDGLDGLQFAASKVGALLRAVPDQVDRGHLFFFASETFAEQKTQDFLREAGKTNEDVEAYRLAVEAGRKAAKVLSEMDRVKALKFEEPKPELARTRDFYLSRWGMTEVRALSFRLVETRHQARFGAIRMLSRNWKAGDNEVALNWFRREQDRHIRHAFERDCRRLWKDYPDLSTEGQMLLTLYERGPCSACRWFVIRRLIELRSLPDYIRKECAYEANDDVREMVDGRVRLLRPRSNDVLFCCKI